MDRPVPDCGLGDPIPDAAPLPAKRVKHSILFRIKLTKKLEDAIGTRCVYCTCLMDRIPLGKRPTRDHVFPRARTKGMWGLYCPPPILIVCHNCNRDKGRHTLREWLARIEVRAKGDAKRIETVRALIVAHPEWADLPAAK